MKKSNLSKAMTALALALLMALSGCGGSAGNAGTESTASPESAGNTESTAASEAADADRNKMPDENNLTSLEVIRLMGNGINLGNTLEAYNHQSYTGGSDPDGFETGWGQPYTTAEMIQGMKNAGFDTIRIPVAWTNGMNYEKDDYTIDERLMNRVETVVN